MSTPDAEAAAPVNVHPAQNPTDGPVHEWFSLSYSNYLVLHRTLMQSMPTDWQYRLRACLEELETAFAHIEQPEAFKVEAATVHEILELTTTQKTLLGITEDRFRGTTPPKGLTDDELREWEAQHEDPDGPVYHQDGSELEPTHRVLVPAGDPIPHYQRGRTYIAPRLPATTPS
ncbi:hypothetical protein OG413_41415 [Streptomyces sp. NBC_01433]|uniref:hypothetical protein n=1 Tax=Streptomyces sp. NBC_01433 TaxID=2903864 RepID=UPI00225491B8|nr:hypothetical protein [Streptomyces sp. NBC_01433]MCX4681663.1 hypothetical protein [Streptomyces sp. NBC_01433]